jgi:hypothetical protein
MSISALQCFICGAGFRTKQFLSHHLEVALRYMYHDHLILQEEPIRPDVPVAHRDDLAALQHFRKITEVVAQEHHVEGGTSLFLTEVTELDAAGQRCLENSVPCIDLPCGDVIPQMTVVSSTVMNPPVVFDPYTTSDAPSTFFTSSNKPPPMKRPHRPRPRASSPPGSESYGDDYDICDASGGEEELVRMSLGIHWGI